MNSQDKLQQLEELLRDPGVTNGFPSREACLEWATKLAPLLKFDQIYHRTFLLHLERLSLSLSGDALAASLRIMITQAQMAANELRAASTRDPMSEEVANDKLNKLLGNQGSIVERYRIARELDDNRLQIAAPYSPQAKEELERRRHERLMAVAGNSSNEGKEITPMIDIFISHGSQDVSIAEALITLLRSALNIEPSRIRCTSVEGYRLSAGASADDQLRIEVRESKLFIALITPISLQSSYVLFELGARWGAKLPMIPLLAAGATPAILPGPIKGLNALDCAVPTQMHQLVHEIANCLGLQPQSPAVYQKYIDELLKQAKRIKEFQQLIITTGLTVHSAYYGAKGKYRDVAQRLNSRISSGALKIRVCNKEATGGDDPMPGEVKTLTVVYSHDRQMYSKEVPEGNELSLP